MKYSVGDWANAIFYEAVKRKKKRPRKKNPATSSSAVGWYSLGFAVVSFALLYINQRKITAALTRALPAPEEPPSR